MAAPGSNIFAALTKTKSKKSKAPKEATEERESKADKHAELEAAIFSQSGTGLSNWADDSEDEEEWGAPHPAHHEEGWEAVSAVLGPMLIGHVSIWRWLRRFGVAWQFARHLPATPHAALPSHLGLQAKGGYSAANYGFDQEEEEEPETESEDEVSGRLRPASARRWLLFQTVPTCVHAFAWRLQQSTT